MVDILAETLGDYDSVSLTGQQLSVERFKQLNKARIRVYGYIRMMAPQSVMDAQDQLFDYLIQVAHGHEQYVWARVRELALVLMNEVRKDIGTDVSPIVYRGLL